MSLETVSLETVLRVNTLRGLPMKSVDVRRKLVHALSLDLIGPDRDTEPELRNEVLSQAP